MVLEKRQLGGQSGHEAGRRLLADMYQAYTGKPAPAVFTGKRGKPYFKDADLYFSISHTREMVFCVLSEKAVGIDAEAVDRDIKISLAEKILSPKEMAQFEKAEDKRLALLTFWVLKEAAGKCTGEGINGYPNHTRFSLDDPRVQVIDNHLVAVIEDEG